MAEKKGPPTSHMLLSTASPHLGEGVGYMTLKCLLGAHQPIEENRVFFILTCNFPAGADF